jgi:precorrin-8X/cobalt-precorrin-8 methylmutase
LRESQSSGNEERSDSFSETLDPGRRIEELGRRRIDSVLDLSFRPLLERRVISAVVQATADFTMAADMAVSEEDLRKIVSALAESALVVCDTYMSYHALANYEPRVCYLADDPDRELTRSAKGILEGIARHGEKAGYVVGTSPSALSALLNSGTSPLFVIGVPVGFVGAVSAKRRLRDASYPKVTNRSEKGGAAVAGAVFHALLREARM